MKGIPIFAVGGAFSVRFLEKTLLSSCSVKIITAATATYCPTGDNSVITWIKQSRIHLPLTISTIIASREIKSLKEDTKKALVSSHSTTVSSDILYTIYYTLYTIYYILYTEEEEGWKEQGGEGKESGGEAEFFSDSSATLLISVPEKNK